MARNVEFKARVHDLEPLRTRVMALGAIGPVALMQTDTFFNVPSGRLKLREFGDHTAELIYYVRPDTEGAFGIPSEFGLRATNCAVEPAFTPGDSEQSVNNSFPNARQNQPR